MAKVAYETYDTSDELYDTMHTYETDIDATYDDMETNKKKVKSFHVSQSDFKIPMCFDKFEFSGR